MPAGPRRRPPTTSSTRLVEAGRRYRERTGGGEALIPIILDGENAWEHFEGGGRPFLRALYRRLSDHPELRTVTMARPARRRAGADRDLPGLLDRRELLHLDRPRRRPARLEPAGRRARGARRRGAHGVDPRRAGRGARRGADRRRQRLVLVVRRRPFVGARPRVRRPVPAAPAERLPAAAEAGARRAVRQQHLGRAAPPAQTEPTALLAPTSTARRPATSNGWAPATLEVREVAGRDAPDRPAAGGRHAACSSASTTSGCTSAGRRVADRRPAGRRATSSR